jgi:Helix-turn-helix domain
VGQAQVDPYISLRGVGAYAGGVSYRSVMRWRRSLGLPCIKVGGRVMVRRSELDLWLSRFRQAPQTTDAESDPDRLAPLRMARERRRMVTAAN